MPPKTPPFPSSFSVSLTCYKPDDGPMVVRGSTTPTHFIIDRYLDAIAELGELLELKPGTLTVSAREMKASVRFSDQVPDRGVRRLLSQLTLIGNDDLCEARRQVEGYPYKAIARLYESFVIRHNGTRRKLPTITIDSSLMLSLTVADVIGGPSTKIRIGTRGDTITVRGLPFNQPFARLINDELLKRTRDAIRAHLPISS